MVDLQNKLVTPTLEDFDKYIRNPVFMQFCLEIMNQYQCKEKIEFSGCSLEKGWNVKFKKAGKSLCTIYPREGYFTVMIVIGRKEKEATEGILPACSPMLREIYHQTKEGNGQRWLMIDLEDNEEVYDDLLRLIKIRRGR